MRLDEGLIGRWKHGLAGLLGSVTKFDGESLLAEDGCCCCCCCAEVVREASEAPLLLLAEFFRYSSNGTSSLLLFFSPTNLLGLSKAAIFSMLFLMPLNR